MGNIATMIPLAHLKLPIKNVATSRELKNADTHFQKEVQAAQRFAAMFIDEVLQETMPNMFGNAVGAQSYQSMFMHSLSKDLGHSAGSMGLMPLLEKSLHIPSSAIQKVKDHPTLVLSDLADPVEAVNTQSISADAQAFVKDLTPLVEKAAQALGVAPRLILAQAALETGWGRSVVGNNLFGIKASPGFPSVLAQTHEANAEGQLFPTIAAFRVFPTIAACLHHYVDLLKTQYPGVLQVGDDARAFALALVHGHYATDPAYAQKIIALADSAPLARVP